MEYWEFNLYLKGYETVLFNKEIDSMTLAYNSGMFSRETKSKPKSLTHYLRKIRKAYNRVGGSEKPVDNKEAQRIHDRIEELKKLKEVENDGES